MPIWVHDLIVIVISVGSATGTGWGVFRLFLGKWLDSRFGQQLEAFKGFQQQELVKLQLQLNTMFDRNIKLHQREFEVLPEAWSRLNDAYNLAHSTALGVSITPNLDDWPPERLEAYIADSFLDDYQKKELRATRDKTHYYSRAQEFHNLGNAWNSCWNFRDYLSKNAIFVPDNIKQQFKVLDELLFGAMLERRTSLQFGNRAQKVDKGVQLHETAPGLLAALEKNIQTRLWISTTMQA